MSKPLSTSAAQPRSRMRRPGYPTLAAAGLSLCLAAGCGGDEQKPNPAGGMTPPYADAKADPPSGDAALDGRAQAKLDGGGDASLPNLAGGPTPSFEPDGGADGAVGKGEGE